MEYPPSGSLIYNDHLGFLSLPIRMAGLDVSDLLGYSSIACWLVAQFPQVLENIRRQSCEGIALPFLANWALGDASNLIGCLLTDQLPFQTYLATYFLLIDLVTIFQYFYYDRKPSPPTPFDKVSPLPTHSRGRISPDIMRRGSMTNPRRMSASSIQSRTAADANGFKPESPPTRRGSTSHRGAGLVLLGSCILFGTVTMPRHQAEAGANNHLGKVLFSNVHPISSAPTEELIIGRTFAWICATLYFTSRLPQIYKNFTRKSVEGLSMSLFVLAFFGNLFYCASILLSPKISQPPPASTDFIHESIPYLIGSGGTLLFDVVIVSQSYIYRQRPTNVRGRASSRSQAVAEEETGLLRGELEDATHGVDYSSITHTLAKTHDTTT